MFNIKVVKITDLIKYCLGFIIVIISINIIIKNIPQKNEKETSSISAWLEYNLTSCIDTTSTIIKDTNNPNTKENQTEKTEFYEEILKSQIGLIEQTEEQEKNEEEYNTELGQLDENKNVVNDEVKMAQTGLTTEVITNNPISLNYNSQFQDVKIKNGTSHELTDDILNPNINIENKNILLFHTHTCESYTPSELYPYNETGNFRTTDLNYSVARLGEELKKYLNEYGYNVIHDSTYHDYPSYNGSYTRSLETVQNILKTNPTDIIFDIHRDAIGSRSDYAPCVKIGDEVAAQIMFVIGSDEGGLWHPNWNQNLKFAVKVQQKAEELYPGLFKPITFTKYRYNQHSGKYASIIEVGATGNTLEQCITSMKYLAKVLSEVIM